MGEEGRLGKLKEKEEISLKNQELVKLCRISRKMNHGRKGRRMKSQILPRIGRNSLRGMICGGKEEEKEKERGSET